MQVANVVRYGIQTARAEPSGGQRVVGMEGLPDADGGHDLMKNAHGGEAKVVHPDWFLAAWSVDRRGYRSRDGEGASQGVEGALVAARREGRGGVGGPAITPLCMGPGVVER